MLAEFELNIVQLLNAGSAWSRLDWSDSDVRLNVPDMAINSTMRLNCSRVAIFAASALVVLSVSGVCHGSCGEYVYSRFHTPVQHGRSHSQHADADRLNATYSENVDFRDRGSELSNSMPGHPTPCHGPNCSQNPTPLAPFAPLATVGDASQDRLIFGHVAMELPSEMSPREDMQTDARTRRGYPLLIEMPPEIAG